MLIWVVCLPLSTCASPMKKFRVEIISNKWPVIMVQIVNLSDKEIRIWESSMSWGWMTREFKVWKKGQEPHYIRRRKDVDFTMNYPAVRTIPPKDKWIEKFDLADGYWIVPDTVKSPDQDFVISVTLSMTKSLDAEQENVTLGEWESKPVRLK